MQTKYSNMENREFEITNFNNLKENVGVFKGIMGWLNGVGTRKPRRVAISSTPHGNTKNIRRININHKSCKVLTDDLPNLF